MVDIKQEDDLRAYREVLASAVLEHAPPALAGIEAHFGESYENTDTPEAIVYARTGGTFRFLAFSCVPWRMWDLHVGVVPLAANQISIGLHISQRAASQLLAELERFASASNLSVIRAEAAVELQANWPPVDVSTTPQSEIVGIVRDLCATLREIASRNRPPKEMSAGRENS